MHMRATYKENMRALINAWNTGPGADEQIDATGVVDAISSGMPLRPRGREEVTTMQLTELTVHRS